MTRENPLLEGRTMASLPDPINPQATSAVRFPRLSYRNTLSDVESIKTMSTQSSSFTTSTNLTSPQESMFCPSPRHPPSDMASSATTRPSSIAPSSTAPKTVKGQTKKRPNFLSGLFGAKEPSTQAFADYQKHLLKQGSSRTNVAGIPGVSSAKLPPTVPKVNSKWDGVPESKKEKEKPQREPRQSTAGASRDISTARSTESDTGSKRRLSQGTLGGSSMHSSSTGNRLADLYGWETGPVTISSSSSAIVDFAAEHRPTTARLQTSHSAPPSSERPPPLDGTLLSPPHNPSLRPGSSQSIPSAPVSPSVPSHSNSPTLTPTESLPMTPNMPSPISPTLDRTSSGPQTSPSSDIKTTLVDIPPSFNEVIVKRSGFDVLGPPATAKRKAKKPPYTANGERPSASRADVPLNSILKKPNMKDTPPRSAAPSYFPDSSSLPLSGPVRRNSARERLALGMTLRNQAVAPWDSPTSSCEGSPQGERDLTPTPEEKQSDRKKGRISLFRKS